ncbi:hypothetical protein [Streptomyces sp. NPDC054995]
MASVDSGTYTFKRPRHDADIRLTLVEGSSEPGTTVGLDGPTDVPGEQHWSLERLANGNCTIRSVEGGTYLSFEGDPKAEKPVVGLPEPREWELLPLFPGHENHIVHVVVPGGPVDGEVLAMDLPVWQQPFIPTPLAITPFRDDVKQAWAVHSIG